MNGSWLVNGEWRTAAHAIYWRFLAECDSGAWELNTQWCRPAKIFQFWRNISQCSYSAITVCGLLYSFTMNCGLKFRFLLSATFYEFSHVESEIRHLQGHIQSSHRLSRFKIKMQALLVPCWCATLALVRCFKLNGIFGTSQPRLAWPLSASQWFACRHSLTRTHF